MKLGLKRGLAAVSRRDRRLVLVQVLLLSLIATLLVRAAWMQVVEGSTYKSAATGNSVREVVTPAQRGLILDQNGYPIVANRSSLTVTVDRTEIAKQKDGGTKVLTSLAEHLGTSYEAIVDRMKPCGTEGAPQQPLCWNGSPTAAVEVATDVPEELGLSLMESKRRFPGIAAELRPARSFPKTFGASATHVSGYLGKQTKEEIDQYSESDPKGKTELIGRSGLERQYNEILSGTPGINRVAMTRNGGVARELQNDPAQAGDNLVTNIDAKLQGVVEAQLAAAVKDARKRGLPADSGAIVVTDVNTGRVLASASAPTYDPEVWVGGIDSKTYKALTSEKRGNALLDHAIGGVYPPASTFKVVTAAAGLESGSFVPGGSYACPSAYSVGGQLFRNYESEAHGSISLSEALAVSCDTIFYRMAHQMWKADGGLKAGSDAQELILKKSREFGLGEKTGIDLPGESSGNLIGRQERIALFNERKDDYCRRAAEGYPEVEPEERAQLLKDYARDFCEEGDQFRAGDALNAAIGQGDTQTTPFQINSMYAAIANGGTLYKPQVARAVLARDGQVQSTIEPEALAQLSTDGSTLSYLRESLAKTIVNGTARNAFAGFPRAKVPIAAKTGTGEVVGKKSTAWFASYAPATAPKYAVTCVVAQGGTGSETCGPAVRKIYEAIFGVTGGSVNPSKSILKEGAAFGNIPQVNTDGLGSSKKPKSEPTPSAGASQSPSSPGSSSAPTPVVTLAPSGRESMSGRLLP